MNVRIKVVADNSPKPAVGAAKVAARPKETRSAPADSEEGESRAPNSPAPATSPSNSPARPATNSQPQESTPKASVDPNGHGAVRTTQMSEIEQRIGGNLINEAYKLFEGPGSRLIG